MKNKTPEVKLMSFVKLVCPEQSPKAVESRDISKLDLPDECEFYLYDSYVGIIEGMSYPFGPEMNVSKRYFKANEYYPDVDHFRVYIMRWLGKSEEDIWDKDNPENLQKVFLDIYNSRNFPKGVAIIGDKVRKVPECGEVIASKNVIEKYLKPEEGIKPFYHYNPY